MNSNNQPRTPVPSQERTRVDRSVLTWLNTYPFIPETVSVIKTEPQLPVDGEGMAMSAITNAYINKKYILGGYQAEYTFKIIYRIKPGNSTNARLEALEMLNRMGDWCTENKPDLSENIHVIQVLPTAQAELYAPYTNGDEDYFITMRITYSVSKPLLS